MCFEIAQTFRRWAASNLDRIKKLTFGMWISRNVPNTKLEGFDSSEGCQNIPLKVNSEMSPVWALMSHVLLWRWALFMAMMVERTELLPGTNLAGSWMGFNQHIGNWKQQLVECQDVTSHCQKFCWATLAFFWRLPTNISTDHGLEIVRVIELLLDFDSSNWWLFRWHVNVQFSSSVVSKLGSFSSKPFRSLVQRFFVF